MNLIECREVLLCNEARLGYIRTIFGGLSLIEALITWCRLISMPGFRSIGFTLATLRLFGLSLYLARDYFWTIRLRYFLRLY